jgi:hypothetical protein
MNATPGMFSHSRSTADSSLRTDRRCSVSSAEHAKWVEHFDLPEGWETQMQTPNDHEFDAYIVLIRFSGVAHGDAQERAHEMLRAYLADFPPPASSEPASAETNHDVWPSYQIIVLTKYSSRQCVLTRAGAAGIHFASQVLPTENYLRLLCEYAQNVLKRKAKALVISNGVDGVSTENEQWAGLSETWPDVEFFNAVLVKSSILQGAHFPSPSLKGFYNWAFFSCEDLRSAWETTLPDDNDDSVDLWQRHHRQWVYCLLLINLWKGDQTSVLSGMIQPEVEDSRGRQLSYRRNLWEYPNRQTTGNQVVGPSLDRVRHPARAPDERRLHPRHVLPPGSTFKKCFECRAAPCHVRASNSFGETCRIHITMLTDHSALENVPNALDAAEPASRALTTAR